MYLEEINTLPDNGAFFTTRIIGCLVRRHYAATGFKNDYGNDHQYKEVSSFHSVELMDKSRRLVVTGQ